MDIKEKILLIDCLLRDMENDRSFRCELRASLAMSLCREVALHYRICNSDTVLTGYSAYELFKHFTTLCDRCHEFAEKPYSGDICFKTDFPYGYGYLDIVHGLPYSFTERSSGFKSYVYKFLNNPNLIFDDFVDTDNVISCLDND